MEYSPASPPIPQPSFSHITHLGLILGVFVTGLVFSTFTVLLRPLFDSTDHRNGQDSEPTDIEMGDMNRNHDHDHHPHSDGSVSTGNDFCERSIEEKLMEVVQSFVYGDEGGVEKWSSDCECVICWEDLKDGEMCRVLPACNHVFHKACLGLWLMEKRVCPLCRVCVQF